MEPEDDKGNVEYKLALIDPSHKKLDTLITQMGYRIQEGDGKAIYWIGVMDDGRTVGVADWAFNQTVNLIKDMAAENDANAVIIHKRNVGNDREVLGKALSLPRMKYLFLEKPEEDGNNVTNSDDMEVQSVKSVSSVGSSSEIGELPERFIGCIHISREPRNIGYNVVTVGATGNADSGKSTLLGVLTRSVLDNGNGSARKHVLTHKHEEDTGKTSAVSHQIMGFDENGDVIDLSRAHNPTWGDVVEKSQRVVKFHDMAGQSNYFKTTSKGLSRHKPNYGILMVSASNGVTTMTIEHLHYLAMLKIPIIVVISKIDQAPKNEYEKTVAQVNAHLKKRSLIPYMVNDMEDAIRVSSEIVTHKSDNKKATITKVIPIFNISNKTGEGLDELRRFLFCLPNYIDYDTEGPVKFFVHDIFQKVRGVGLVVSGMLESGTVRVGDTKYIGPNSEGKFTPVYIKSIQVNRQDVSSVEAGYECTFAFRQPPERINRSMNILDRELCTCSYAFKAKIRTFKKKSSGISNSVTMRIGYQPHMTINNIARSGKFVYIETIEREGEKKKAPLMDRKTQKVLNRQRVVRPGDEAIIYIRFDRPFRLEPGDIFIFREQLTYGSGTIIEAVDEYPRLDDNGNIVEGKPIQINRIKNPIVGNTLGKKDKGRY